MDARGTLTVGGERFEIFRLDALQQQWDVARLPYTLRVLLENVLRGGSEADVEAVAGWVATEEPSREISFRPSRVLHQDFTGVPAIVDLAAMRNAMRDLGGDPDRINPVIPAELVIDHSVQVDEFATRLAFARNVELEFERNRERYAFLRWGQGAFADFKVVPPGTGIVHQVNLEYLARVVESRDGRAFPDTLVGTDSHTTMVNGLGVLGWGVGGIEAEAAMLGEALSMLVPQVVGFRLTGELPGGSDGDRPRPDRHRDPAPDGRGREVRRVLRAGARRAPARRPRDHREHVARVRRHLRLLPGGRRDAPVPAADRAPGRAGRARRGVLQGEPALARGRRAPDLLPGRRARPRHGRAEPGRSAPPAGPRSAARGEGGLPARAARLRRRLRKRTGRGRRRELPRLRPARARRARPRGRRLRARSGRRGRGGGGRTGRRARRARRPRVRAPARQRRDRRDHELHEHLQSAGDGRGRAAGEEGGRARARAKAVGEVEPGAGIAGRHRLLRAGGADPLPGGPRLPHGRLRLHDLHRELRAAPGGDLRRDHGQRPRRLRRPVRKPQLRGADPPRGEGELPRLTAARGRLRARRPDGHRPRHGADRARSRRCRGLPARPVALLRRDRRDDRRDRLRRALPGPLRRRLHRRRDLAGAGEPVGEPLRVGAGIDVRTPAAVLRRHAAPAGGRRGHPRRRAASSCSATR